MKKGCMEAITMIVITIRVILSIYLFYLIMKYKNTRVYLISAWTVSVYWIQINEAEYQMDIKS